MCRGPARLRVATNGGSFGGVNPAVYTGQSYWPYAPESINPYHQLIFSISAKM